MTWIPKYSYSNIRKTQTSGKRSGGGAEKVDSDFIDLISKRYDTKKKYSNYKKLHSKH